MWPFSKKSEPAQAEETGRGGDFGTAIPRRDARKRAVKRIASIIGMQPAAAGEAMDSAVKSLRFGGGESIPDAQLYWYASQGFIGYQACAIIAQHWLVDKACLMPGRDAIRQGYDIDTGGDGDDAIIKAIRKADKRHGINRQMREFIHLGRVFGIRVAIFKVKSSDPEYYQKPFNLDGVAPGSYQGISQVDPNWCSPILTGASVNDPASMRYYEPEFWMIGGTKYHRSHLAIYVPFPVADMLKPSYQYGGASVPQRIFNRVYASERSADEAPQLLMTKRSRVYKTDYDAAVANPDAFEEALETAQDMMDNYGIWAVPKDDDVIHIDTALADLDVNIMTQYQLVAAIANVPAAKLLGTTPKGFNATGEFEAASYREELESIQTNDLTPMLERHHAILMRSEIAPKLGIDPVETSVTWAPLDSPTAEQWATINKTKMETMKIAADAGAIDGMDIRQIITADRESDFFGLPEIEEPDNGEEDAPAADPQA
jgi:hypothetical protein